MHGHNRFAAWLSGLGARHPRPPHLPWHAHPHSPRRPQVVMHGDLTITHDPSGAVRITHQPHGEGDDPALDASPIDSVETGIVGYLPGYAEDPSYGEGDTGRGFHPSLMEARDDPFALSLFGEDATEEPPEDFSVPEKFSAINMTEVVDNDYDSLPHSGRSGTMRHPDINFGLESDFYSGFGPAPVMGCEIGCAAPGAARMKG